LRKEEGPLSFPPADVLQMVIDIKSRVAGPECAFQISKDVSDARVWIFEWKPKTQDKKPITSTRLRCDAS
jgi:hypothetical protein